MAKSLSEFGLIARYFTHRAGHTLLGVGDDAALIRPRRGHVLAISTDMLVEGRHFFKGADPQSLGHKTLAVNLSDLAAMGATPRWAMLALALPHADARWLAAFSRGFMRLAQAHQVDLIGGDTTRGPLTLCVQIIGEVPAGKALRRDGAHAGDAVWVSGTLGAAALAVAAKNNKIFVNKQLLNNASRYLDKPTPRIALGIALRGIARSAIDISDGLVADLGHICERSDVRAEINLDALPVTPMLRTLRSTAIGRQCVLAGGDDYELCFTTAPSRQAAVLRAALRVGVPVARVGTLYPRSRTDDRVVVIDAQGKRIKRTGPAGFDHFG